MSAEKTPTREGSDGCCGKCAKAEQGTCSKLDRVLASLKPTPKETRHAV